MTPLPSLAAPSSLAHQASSQEGSSIQFQWPSGRTPCGFLTNKSKLTALDEDTSSKCNSNISFPKKKTLLFSPSFGSQSRKQAHLHDSHPPSVRKVFSASKQSTASAGVSEPPSETLLKPNMDTESQCKTPIMLPAKRKLSELKDIGFLSSSGKRLHTGEQGLKSPVGPTSNTVRKTTDAAVFFTPSSSLRDHGRLSASGCPSDYLDETQYGNSLVGMVIPSSQIGLQSDPQNSNMERLTLDSLVVQFLKHQHRQCPAPITTLPPLSLLHPHVCPEPRRSLEAPSNVTARLGTREFKSMYGGIQVNRRDRQFVYSRFRPWRSCRDETGTPLTCITFLGDSSHIAVGCHSGELKIFDSTSNSILETCTSHQSPITTVQSYLSGETQMVLSSSSQEVRLWDASGISGGPMHSFEGCKAARFSNSGDVFAALPSEPGRREILLYDIQTSHLKLKLLDSIASSTGRAQFYSNIHFNTSDTMLLWNGVLWDTREPSPVHHFDQFTDYGGGGFHPAGNEVCQKCQTCTTFNDIFSCK